MNTRNNDSKRARARKSAPKPITESRLRNIALHYLERYATASANLRRVLIRRVVKARLEDPAAAPEAEAWIDTLLARFESAGVLDDAVYARAQAQTLHRRGVSAKGVRHRLSAKGVAAADIDGALEALRESLGEGSDDAPDNADMLAACNYARRRRLGPWRRTDRAGNRDRDLAALGRQGFSFHIASTVIDSPDVESLETREGC
ncbi:MAG: RecX family transcriptional regulator [Rhodospirillaceae bacterium]|jgi:regulatory protein|nr:RecX family transcriptional regulator [Rhodospirillaceae bacterium]MBT5666368.1 RecX family transcriptional regulator [Rhodospirillaceae bacterium]MBT5810271.1 RecX family transcriptional regulator [Rhodospirillaceae bacterium]